MTLQSRSALNSLSNAIKVSNGIAPSGAREMRSTELNR
jgi:hypothetical protein